MLNLRLPPEFEGYSDDWSGSASRPAPAQMRQPQADTPLCPMPLVVLTHSLYAGEPVRLPARLAAG